MIKNIYYKCNICGNVVTKFMDDKYKDEVLENLSCPNCGSNTFNITDNDTHKVVVKNKVRDNRAIDKEKYMSQDYKDIRANINRIHREKSGILGEAGRKYLK